MCSFYTRLGGEGKPVPIERLNEFGVPSSVVSELLAMGGMTKPPVNQNKLADGEAVRDAS